MREGHRPEESAPERIRRPDDARRPEEAQRSGTAWRAEGARRVVRARWPDEALPARYGGRQGLGQVRRVVDLRIQAPLAGPPVPEMLCTACGFQSDDNEGFCPACGCYLEWHGETVIPPLPGPEAALPLAASVAAPPRHALAVPPQATGPVGLRPRPTAVRPMVAKPRPLRRTVVAEPEIPPGGPECRECFSTNPPGRRFCRRCGLWLEEIVVVVAPPLPWWRRLWNWLIGRVHRDPARFKAGERPIRRRRTTSSTVRLQLRRLAVVTAVVALVIPGIRRPLAHAISAPYQGMQHVLSETYAPVRPIRVEAESSVADHPPELAIDGLSNTYWAEGAPGVGEGTGITFSFSEPVKLYRLIVTAGASGSEEAFLNEPRPRVMHVVFDSGGTKDLVLEDVPTPQTFKFKSKRITKVEFHITLTHKSAKGDNCAVSEFEFFTKT